VAIQCRKQQQQQHPFNSPLSTQVSQYHKDQTNLDFTEPKDSGWQWHHLQLALDR